MFCDQCGSKFDENSKFCGRCGSTRKASSIWQTAGEQMTDDKPVTIGEQAVEKPIVKTEQVTEILNAEENKEGTMADSSPPTQKKSPLMKVLLVGAFIVAFIIGFTIFYSGSDIVDNDNEEYASTNDEPSMPELDEIAPETPSPEQDEEDAEELEENPFNLGVWDDIIQLEIEGITIDIPIPSRDINIHYEHYFLINTLWYSVSGGFDPTSSIEEWNTGVIQMVRNSDMILNFSYQKYELEGLHLIAMERERDDGGVSRFDTGFFLAFKYRDHFFHMSITLPEGFAEQGVVKEDFLEAYGINHFINAGLLEMNEWRQAQDVIHIGKAGRL